MNNIKILELLASKICHDLISPVGAISNGIEILEELGPDAGDEVTSLIASSTIQANAKLKTLRMAYGLGGADQNITTVDIHALFGEFIASEKRLSQDWNPHEYFGIEPRSGLAKILLCALILISETLPKGGIISVKAGEDNTILVTGNGENARFQEEALRALERKTNAEDLPPRYVHTYITGLFSQHYGFEITPENTGNDFICLRLKCSNVF
ncbi:MAG: hypothetical protein COA45_07770 [Zetaproteobacteria bacterium]|nr:MAG: hypothetical protein COA45_07770 [Zetaproteobacteria bacterium]